jgi:hypothetical protein
MKKFNALLGLFFFVLVLAGCDKDEDPEPTKEDMLRAKNWNITAAKAVVTVAGSPIEFDYYNVLLACQKDNLLQFKENDALIMDEGASKCTPTAPQTSQGTWTLTENATTGDVITVNGNILLSFGLVSTAPRNLNVLTLDNQNLKVSFSESVIIPAISATNPIPAKIDLTFTAQ